MKFKKILTSSLISLLVLGSVSSAGAMTLFYANSGRDGLKVFVEAKFTPDTLTTSSNYGLEVGKYVTKVTIRLVEGDYDESKSTTGPDLIRLEKTNNPLKSANGTWKWTYK